MTLVAGIESRGFIFGSCVARILGAGFVPIRKPGKLPWTRRRNEYILEYGTDAIEIHDDALTTGRPRADRSTTCSPPAAPPPLPPPSSAASTSRFSASRP